MNLEQASPHGPSEKQNGADHAAKSQGDLISLGSATSNRIDGHTTPAEAVADIQRGKWAKEVAAVRSATGDTAGNLKTLLPAILWAGKFNARKNDGIEKFSGFLCADIDKVPERIAELHDTAHSDPHAAAAFVSPSGTGIKIVFRVPVASDASQHRQNFDAVRRHVAGIYSAKVDEAAKDIARLCFVSHDAAAFFKADAVPLEVNSQDVAPKRPEVRPAASVAPSTRTQIAEQILGTIQRTDEGGYCDCPGKHLHTTANAAKDCKVMLDGVPTIKCFHDSCSGIVAGVNHELRSQIAKAQKPTATDSNRAAIANETEPENEPSKNPLPEIDNAATLCADENISLPPEIIQGVLHQGLKAVLGSNAKARKTWILLDAAISVATGTPFWKWETRKGRVLYINFEIPRPFIRSRIKRICEAKAITDLGNLDVWTLRGHAAPFWQLVPQLMERIKSTDYSLILIDPIYKGLGGRDENSAGDIGELCNELEKLAVETGAAVLYAAHFSKGNQASKEAIDRISGSGVFGRDADSLIILTKHEQPDSYTVDLILRNLPEQPPFVVQWQFPVMAQATELDPEKLKQAAGRKPENMPDDLLKLLPADGLTNPDFLAVAKEQRISERNYYRLKKELENTGKILLSKISGKWTPISSKNTP